MRSFRTAAILTTIAMTSIVMFAVPAVALAHRRATSAERAAMLYTAGNRSGYGHGSDAMPRSFPARCAYAVVATVVKGSQWGAYTFNEKAAGCEKFGFNSVVFEHKIGVRWYVVWAGSEGYPTNVPRRIANDISNGLKAAF